MSGLRAGERTSGLVVDSSIPLYRIPCALHVCMCFGVLVSGRFLRVRSDGAVEFIATSFGDNTVKFVAETLPNNSLVLVARESLQRRNGNGLLGWALALDVATGRLVCSSRAHPAAAWLLIAAPDVTAPSVQVQPSSTPTFMSPQELARHSFIEQGQPALAIQLKNPSSGE